MDIPNLNLIGKEVRRSENALIGLVRSLGCKLEKWMPTVVGPASENIGELQTRDVRDIRTPTRKELQRSRTSKVRLLGEVVVNKG
jgi:hypothetical protein